ncbi:MULTISPECIES: hypothetical protein [Streptomyces]|uniref:DUF2335 domain-containing protein n=1 Tax=Streptomyces dengpaensis TaxID=2049881 RepID=A0ABM6SJC8_9ACTN|nr:MULTISPECIES: hypothetical protein [Streptomyces]AVH54497.1 hypothetical protein C4B68_00045 [Streptomyces dengpaensis]PIB00238.1 hypothetical protein B1C81_38930 [Streptomyces sp. HG99]
MSSLNPSPGAPTPQGQPLGERNFLEELLAEAELDLAGRRGEAAVAEAVLDFKRHQIAVIEADLHRRRQRIAVIEADVRVLQRHQRARQRMRSRRARRRRVLRTARTCTRIALTAFGCFSFTVATYLFIHGLPGSTEMFGAAASAWAAAIALPPVR